MFSGTLAALASPDPSHVSEDIPSKPLMPLFWGARGRQVPPKMFSGNSSEKIGREQGILQPTISFPVQTEREKKLMKYWKSFDGIYCLSLRKRLDRQEAARKVFSEIACPAQFYLCEKGKYSPAYHISNAHSDVAEHALKQGYQNILVFEDDAELYSNVDVLSLLRSVVSFVGKYRYSFFFLGCFPHAVTFRVIPSAFEHVYEIRGGWSQWHAYCLSRKGMEAVAKFQLPRTAKRGLDCFFDSEPERYALFPMMFRQSSSPSNYATTFSNQIKYWVSSPLTSWAFSVRINLCMLLLMICTLIGLLLIKNRLSKMAI